MSKPSCGQFRSAGSFSIDSSSTDGLNPQCRGCAANRAAGYAPKRRALYSEDLPKARAHHRKQKYGIDQVAFDAIIASQGGRCAICREPFPTDRLPTRGEQHVDHDHATGKVRGILCGRCNTGIGLLGENIASLQRAQSYLSPAVSHVDHEHF